MTPSCTAAMPTLRSITEKHDENTCSAKHKSIILRILPNLLALTLYQKSNNNNYKLLIISSSCYLALLILCQQSGLVRPDRLLRLDLFQ